MLLIWFVSCRFHDFKCHTEFCVKKLGLGDQPDLLDLAHKGFCYFLAAQDRADLDAQLQIHFAHVMPTIVSHDDEKMAAYVHFLMYTRLAPEGHGGYLRNDNKAKTHCIYGQHNAPLAPMTNNPVESIIRSQMVDAVGRRSFTSVYLLVVYLSGHSIDRRPVPHSMPRNVRLAKDRSSSERYPRLPLFDSLELACAYTTLIVPGGVKPTDNAEVLYVGDVAHKENLTNDPKLRKNADANNDVTRACIERFDDVIDMRFEKVSVAVDT